MYVCILYVHILDLKYLNYFVFRGKTDKKERKEKWTYREGVEGWMTTHIRLLELADHPLIKGFNYFYIESNVILHTFYGG
jgi:hypothetical protein